MLSLLNLKRYALKSKYEVVEDIITKASELLSDLDLEPRTRRGFMSPTSCETSGMAGSRATSGSPAAACESRGSRGGSRAAKSGSRETSGSPEDLPTHCELHYYHGRNLITYSISY